jgi:hypothetical protein
MSCRELRCLLLGIAFRRDALSHRTRRLPSPLADKVWKIYDFDPHVFSRLVFRAPRRTPQPVTRRSQGDRCAVQQSNKRSGARLQRFAQIQPPCRSREKAGVCLTLAWLARPAGNTMWPHVTGW